MPRIDLEPEELAGVRALARSLAAPTDADDLVHDAWLSTHGFDGPRTRGWWSTVLRRRRAMAHRAHLRRMAREAKADVPAEPRDPDRELQQGQLVEALLAALKTLPLEERELVLGRYCEDKTAVELAQERGLPASTVRSRVARSLERLRNDLDRRYGQRELWMPVVMTIPNPGIAAGGTQGGMLMSYTTMKILAGASAVAVSLGCAAWAIQDPDEPEIETTRTDGAATPTAGAAPIARDSKADRSTWKKRQRAIADRRQARAKRRGRQATKKHGGYDPDEALRQIESELGLLMDEELTPVLEPVISQGVPLFVECIELLPDDAQGKLHFRATVQGEPDIGGIVDNIEVLDNSLNQPEFAECLQESTYSISIDDVQESISKAFDITLDMEDRSLEVETAMDFDKLFALRDSDPQAWQSALKKEELRKAFGMLLDEPEFAASNPDMAAALAADLAQLDK